MKAQKRTVGFALGGGARKRLESKKGGDQRRWEQENEEKSPGGGGGENLAVGKRLRQGGLRGANQGLRGC